MADPGLGAVEDAPILRIKPQLCIVAKKLFIKAEL